jgi:hypothetical protein
MPDTIEGHDSMPATPVLIFQRAEDERADDCVETTHREGRSSTAMRLIAYLSIDADQSARSSFDPLERVE